MLHIKFGFVWPSGFRGEDIEYYGNIHVYCPGVGEYEHLGQIFFSIINIQSYYTFPARFHLKILLKNFPHSNALATYVDRDVK